jgi:pimeloyl-ACP methyl ester carboxylesterase
VTWANGDRFQPVSIGENLQDALPNATWKLIKGGHFHPLESDALAEAIVQWNNS